MKSLLLFAAFVVASVSAFGQCSTSLFNTIAHLEGVNPSQLTKSEFRQLAKKYAGLVGETYDTTVKNARIAQKLCGLLAERQNTKCLDLQPTSTIQADSFYLAYDSLQALPYFDSLVFNEVATIQADNVQDTSTQANIQALKQIDKPIQYAPIKFVLQDLRKNGYSPTEARCEVKNRIQANNGLKYDYKLNTEVKATNLDRIKCEQKTKSSLKSKKIVRNGGAKFKTKVSFKTKIRKLKSRINMVFGTCLK